MTDEAAPAVTLTRMAMGSDVPEWLLAAEPRSPGAFLDRVRFAQNVLLLELPDVYLLEPVTPSDHSLFDTGRSNDCLFVATGKPVRVPTGIWTFMTKDQAGASVTQFNDGRLGAPPAQQNMPVPDYNQGIQKNSQLTPYALILEAQRAADQRSAAQQAERLRRPPGLFRRWWLALFG